MTPTLGGLSQKNSYDNDIVTIMQVVYNCNINPISSNRDHNYCSNSRQSNMRPGWWDATPISLPSLLL